ncbi:hypothetical protein PR048_008428 [Dryococelus australis]|uniref:PiggyBac transposable element-derived protein domain-containing protein n=1 Tax=Dryococelus australis TaxID=614101 RepID=A0ABQ9HX30_9NEOP|nr:hypothetical protein PR048_008428 [Dryococelus australis]
MDDNSDNDPDYLLNSSSQRFLENASTKHQPGEGDYTRIENAYSSDEENEYSGIPAKFEKCQKKKSTLEWTVVSPEVSEKMPVVWEDSSSPVRKVDLPIDYFGYFFDDSLLNIIVEQSSLFSVQKNVNRPLNLTKNELEQFLGICMMSIYGLPRSKMYWAKNIRVDKSADVMA